MREASNVSSACTTRYSMADNHSHSIPTFGKSENGQSSSESGGNRAAHQGLPGSSGNGQNHRERRQQVVRDLKVGAQNYFMQFCLRALLNIEAHCYGVSNSAIEGTQIS